MGAIFSGASLSWPRSSPLQRGVTISLGAHSKVYKRLRRGTATGFLHFSASLTCSVWYRENRHLFILPSKQRFLNFAFTFLLNGLAVVAQQNIQVVLHPLS